MAVTIVAEARGFAELSCVHFDIKHVHGKVVPVEEISWAAAYAAVVVHRPVWSLSIEVEISNR